MIHVLNIGVPRTGTVYVQETLSNVRPHGHYHFTASDWSFANFKPIPPEWADDFKLGVVRNPFDLLVSHYSLLRRMDVLLHYYDRNLAGLDFREWLAVVANRRGRYPQRHPLHFQYFKSDWSLGLDYLARFETLDIDLAEVAQLTGAEFTARAPVNTSDRGDWQDYYDDEMLAMVEDAWFADLTYFGYDRRGVTDRALTTFGYRPRPLRTITARPETPWQETMP